MKKDKGLALFEIIIIIAVIAILAAALAPLIFKSEDYNRNSRAKKELALIYKAILGDLKNNFGYIGDMGVFPSNLKDLYVQGSQPSPSEAYGGSGVYYGWKGPYLSVKNSDSTGIIDPYGNYYLQFFLKLNSNSPCEDSDTKCRWFLMSSGKDGSYNSSDPFDKSLSENKDNIYYPQNPLVVDRVNSYNTILSTKNLRVLIVRAEEKLISNVRFTVYFPAVGVVTPLQSDFSNPANFTIPIGKRVIVVSLESDSGSIIGQIKSFVSNFQSGIVKNEFIKVNSTIENLNIQNINFTSGTVCPLTTCTGFCASVCCNSHRNKCRKSPFWMWYCISTGCYSQCCSGGGGGSCTLELSVDSNLNSDGTSPKFNVYIEGFDSNGVMLLGPSLLTKNSSSPFFTYDNPSVDCNLKTIRLYSTGGGATLTRNL